MAHLGLHQVGVVCLVWRIWAQLQQDKSLHKLHLEMHGAIKDLGYYSSIHQESLAHKYGGEGKDQIKPSSLDAMDFSSLIRAGEYDDNEDPNTVVSRKYAPPPRA